MTASTASDFFDAVRRAFADVARTAAHVKIREDRIEAYAAALPGKAPENLFDPEHHFLGDAEGTAAYVLTLDSINFGSGYKPYLAAEGWELINRSIYFSLSTRLKHHFETDGPIPAARLAAFTPEDSAALLGLDLQKPYSREFAGLCAQTLSELGQFIEKHYDGRFMGPVKEANGSAAVFVARLADMKQFQDVPFYKRAQIAAADLHLAFAKLGADLFRDIGRLTMFADNAVPHVLHVDGILEYTPELAARIARGEPIPAGSAEESEIRACAGHAVELIAARKGMNAMSVDHVLWHKSAEDARYRATPPHRTLTPFY